MSAAELVAELACPVDWDKTSVGPELARWLDFRWFAECHQHQVAGEVSSLFSADDWRVTEDHLVLVDAESTVHDVRAWIPKARSIYRNFSRRFQSLVVVDRSVYPKHYAPPASALAEVQAISLSRGEGVLLPVAEPSLQNELVWAALDDVVCKHMVDFDDLSAHTDPKPPAQALSQLLARDKMLIAVQLCRIIGASGGLPRSHAMMDFDFSTPQVHMYPVSESEYQGSKLQAYVQGWKYGLPREGDA